MLQGVLEGFLKIFFLLVSLFWKLLPPSKPNIYILETEVSKFVTCSGVVSPFELRCRLSHPSFSLLKKLYLQFSSLSSLNCESCQYIKLNCVHLSHKVNKQAFAPCELVYYDV